MYDCMNVAKEYCTLQKSEIYIYSTLIIEFNHRRNEERGQGVPWAPLIRSKMGPIRSKIGGKGPKWSLFGVLSSMKIPLEFFWAPQFCSSISPMNTPVSTSGKQKLHYSSLCYLLLLFLHEFPQKMLRNSLNRLTHIEVSLEFPDTLKLTGGFY